LFHPWLEEIWRVVWLLAIGYLLDWVFGQDNVFVFLALVIYVIGLFYHLHILERWLSERRTPDPPETKGMWGLIYNHIYRLHSHNRNRKRKLALMVTRFQEAAAAMPDGIIILRSNDEIEWFNGAARKLLGLRTPHDVGQVITNLLRHPLFMSYLYRLDYAEPLIISSPENDSTILSIHLVPYGKEQRLLVAQDITRLQRLEDMRRHFVANVSHELKTPLTVIMGYLEMMIDMEDDCARQWHRQLRQMSHQGQRMQGIVEDLLLLSRLETQEANKADHEINVSEMMSHLINDAKILSGDQNHIIEFNINKQLAVCGNESELKSAFSNLIFNAIRYTPQGGQITINWRSNDGQALLEVCDTGVGIASHHIPRLTERFYRVDVARSRETGGTGLGLAIVKHVMNRHEGQLRITSRLGKGSQFRCVFPATRVIEHTRVIETVD